MYCKVEKLANKINGAQNNTNMKEIHEQNGNKKERKLDSNTKFFLGIFTNTK